MRGGIGSEVGNEKDYRNRTTIVKRRQGTVSTVRRSRSLLKQSSSDIKLTRVCEAAVMEAKLNTGVATNGKAMPDPPESKRMVGTERDARNLGGPSASSRSAERRGRAVQRKKTTRRVSSVRRRGESDRSISARGKVAVLAAIPTRVKGVTGQRSYATRNISRRERAGVPVGFLSI